MLAVTIQSFGSPDGLVPTDLPEPVAAPGQVVIDVEAIGVGGVDAVIRRGTLGRPGIEPGYVPGSEVAGTVVAVGDERDAGWLGRRVWAFTGIGGAYAERAVAETADLTPLEDGFDAVGAVTLGSAAPSPGLLWRTRTSPKANECSSAAPPAASGSQRSSSPCRREPEPSR